MNKVLLFGAIASVLTINSVLADTIVTSRGYVDAQDALKQDKITAGTTGNVVLYNGTSNGQTQFTGRAIYDGTNDYDETTDANKLITAGAVSTMTPNLPTGNSGYAVLYDSNGDIGGEFGIDYNGGSWFDSEGGAMVPVGDYNGIGNHDEELLTVKALRVNLTDDLSTRGDHGDGAIPTASSVVAYAQPKKTCAGWADGTTTYDTTHTNANCVLWNFPDGPASWFFVPGE